MADKILEPRVHAAVPDLSRSAMVDDGYGESSVELRELLSPLARRWRPWLLATVAAGALGGAGSFLITPQFTSTTTFLPPQQQQGGAASALASLGALAALAGAGNSMKSPADQFVSLMQSVTATDRIIDRFHLLKVYDDKYRHQARKDLGRHTTMTLGKKDGLISVAVEDEDPQRAAAIANQYVEELRTLTSTLAVSEAQQRRVFFEKQMLDTKAKMVAAQVVLQKSGISAGALKADPRTAAEQYARLRAQETAADIKLQTLRSSLADSAPEVQRQETLLDALRSQISQIELASTPQDADADYIGKYRDFKYQETLFELLAKQYELARVDEAREGALIQVVDPALPAESKSSPKRTLMAIGSAFLGALIAGFWIIVRDRRTSRKA
jgi:uncharacterized protein involved in exopolysaccharide biosynthesis